MSDFFRHDWRAWAVVVMLAVTPACSTTQADPSDTQATAEATASEPPLNYDPADVTPPEDAADYTPLTGDELERARLPLEAVLERIEQPDFLQETAEEGEAPAPPLTAARAYARGREAFRSGDVGEAVNQLRLAQRLAPRVPDSYRLLGRIRSATGNLPMAEHGYEQAARLDRTDLETLVMLGRFAQEQQRHDRAIALFAAADRALEGTGAAERPAAAAITDYHLASALATAGYADAARARFQRFLGASRDNLGAGLWARQLSVVDRQSDVIHRTLGDLYQQLGDPDAALENYNAAVGDDAPDRPLAERLAYTHLRLGEPDAAREAVIAHVADTGGSAAALGLVRYLVEQGLSPDSLGDQLRDLYVSEGEHTSLALALAELLPRDEGIALLQEHLRKQPKARPAFEQLVQMKLATPATPTPVPASAPTPGQLADLLVTVADAMAAAPEQARSYGAYALSQLGPLDRVNQGLAAMPPEQRARPMIRVLEALALAAQQQLDPAVEILQQTLRQHPDNELARLELIRLRMARNELDQAAELLGPLEGRDDPQLVRLRAQILAATGESDAAIALLDRLITDGAASDELYLEKARLQLTQTPRTPQNVAAAEQTLLDGLNVHPRSEPLFTALFEIYDATGDPNKWQALMRRMLGSIPQSRLGRLKRAEWLSTRESAEAERLLQGLLEENAQDVEALDILLDLYQRSRRTDEARQLLDRMLADDPNNVQLLSKAGEYYLQVGDVAAVIDVAERLVELRPASEERIQHLAALYLRAGQADKAAELLRQKVEAGQIQPNMTLILQLWQALTLSEKHEEALQLVSDELARPEPMNVRELVRLKWRTQVDMGRFDAAEQTLRDAMARFPAEAADLGYQLAAVATLRGDRERSEQIMEQLVAEHPEHAGLNNDLAYVWSQQDKNLDRALEMAQRAVAAEGENPAYLDTLGWVLYKLGRFEEAATRLRQAAALAARRSAELRAMTRTARQLQAAAREEGAPEPTDQDPMAGTRAVVAEHLGDALYQLGREDQAVRQWREAMEHRLRMPPDEASEDPDLGGMVDRLGEKLAAVEAGEPAPVATAPGDEADDPDRDAMVEDLELEGFRGGQQP